jgi:hypothetical protein
VGESCLNRITSGSWSRSLALGFSRTTSDNIFGRDTSGFGEFMDNWISADSDESR